MVLRCVFDEYQLLIISQTGHCTVSTDINSAYFKQGSNNGPNKVEYGEIESSGHLWSYHAKK